MERICAILGVCVVFGPALWAQPAAPPLDLQAAEAGRFPGAAELEARAHLAELRRELAETGTLLAERPSISGWLGARRLEDDGSSADAEIEGEFPLLAGRGERQAFADALLKHAATLEKAAAAEGRLALRRAYAEALLAERQVALRDEELALLRRWQERAAAAVDAGGVAPFELELIGLEADGVAAARAAADAERAAAWASLAALAQLPAEPSALAALPPVALPTGDRTPTSPAADGPLDGNLVLRALAARYELAAARSRLERSRRASRFALLGGAAKEGDESVLRFGLTYRPFLAGEMAAVDAAASGALAALARQLEIEKASLEGRYRAARRLLATAAPSRTEEAAARVVAAIELRLLEGKTSPAEALAARRQVFALRAQQLENTRNLQQQQFEILYLTEKEAP